MKRWWENNRARSPLSADVLLRNLGLYCEINATTPDKILNDVRDGSLKAQFSDFVRKMEREGRVIYSEIQACIEELVELQ